MKLTRNIFIEIIIIFLFILSSTLVFFNDYPEWLKWTIPGVTVVLTLIFLYWYFIRNYTSSNKKSDIQNLLLVNENGEIEKNWHIADEIALVIGKSYKNQSVDIDLSEVEYAVLIGKEHAVMNLVDGKWYLEDLGSQNGTGVKSVKDNDIHKLGNVPRELEKEDQIYIGKTKLILR